MLAGFDTPTLLTLLLGALLAGFTQGFAGFGTALVASGLWFHVLPAAMVPPLVAMASVSGQLVGIATVRQAFDLRRCAPYLIGAVVGVPLGVAALSAASPAALKTAVGIFLFAYAAAQLSGFGRLSIGAWGGRPADGAVGLGGGILGGFSGLSGPLPLIWLQLRGGSGESQRAVYQPFNLIVLALAAAGMAVAGRIDVAVMTLKAICLPITALGAWLGAHAYRGIGEAAFRRVVLLLLLVSGALLVGQAFLR
jgi:uncharacterized protein